MSLDVHLTIPTEVEAKGSGVFIREEGQTRELRLDEVKTYFPDYNGSVVEQVHVTSEVFSANITHNLGNMASEAGIYEYVWRPEELGIMKAKELIEPLKAGIAELKRNPIKYKQFNPSNGWGSYDIFVPWLEKYLVACEEYPEAEITVSR